MRRDGFTLIELLVVIGIISVLAMLMLPALGLVQQQAKQTKCASNQRQLGVALMMYAEEHDDTLPNTYNNLNSPAWRWTEAIAPYAESSNRDNGNTSTSLRYDNSVLAGCPLYPNPTGPWDVGYGLNGAMRLPGSSKGSDTRNAFQVFAVSSLTNRSRRALIGDCTAFALQMASNIAAQSLRHRNRINTLMCDLHIQPLSLTDHLLSLTDPTRATF